MSESLVPVLTGSRGHVYGCSWMNHGPRSPPGAAGTEGLALTGGWQWTPPPSPIARFPNSVQSEGFTRGIACRGKGSTLDLIHTALLHLSHEHARKALSLVLCSPHTKMDQTDRSSGSERSRQILNDSTSVQSSKRLNIGSSTHKDKVP